MTVRLSPLTVPVTVLAAAGTAPFPPTAWGMVQYWNSTAKCMPEFDLLLWEDGTSDSLTTAKIYAGIPLTLALSITAITSFDHTTNQATLNSHGLSTGDGPVQLTNVGGAVPAGLSLLTNYWIIVTGVNTFKFATSFANAMASTPVPVAFTTNGTGTTSYTGTAACQRVHWMETLDINGNQIGRAHDGAVALTSVTGWRQRFQHSPLTVAYAVSATLSAGTLSASVTPIYSE